MLDEPTSGLDSYTANEVKVQLESHNLLTPSMQGGCKGLKSRA